MKRTLKIQSMVLIVSLLLGSLPLGASAQVAPRQVASPTDATTVSPVPVQVSPVPVQEDTAALVAQLNADPLFDSYVSASDALGTQLNQQTSTMTQQQLDYAQEYANYIQAADLLGTVPEDGVTQELSLRIGFADPNAIDQLQQSVDGSANQVLDKYERQFSAFSDDEVDAALKTAVGNELTATNAPVVLAPAAGNPARDACIAQCKKDYAAELALIAAALLARLRKCRRLPGPLGAACKKAAYAVAAAATAAASVQLAVCIAACYIAHPDKKEAEAVKENLQARLIGMSSNCACDTAAKGHAVAAARSSTFKLSNLLMSAFSAPALHLR